MDDLPQQQSVQPRTAAPPASRLRLRAGAPALSAALLALCRFAHHFAAQMRSELATKEIILLQKEAELLEKEQTVMVLKEEVRHPGDARRGRHATPRGGAAARESGAPPALQDSGRAGRLFFGRI